MNYQESDFWNYKIAEADMDCDRAEMKKELAIISELGLSPIKDGDQYCFLWGKNLQEGIAGFGDNVRDAVLDFNKNYYE